MRSLSIQLACPAKPGSRLGNRITALRWQAVLRDLGHRVKIVGETDGACDVLIALHAKRSAASVQESKAASPKQPVVVAITGTDLYRDGRTRATQRSLELADRLIVLQAATLDDLPAAHRQKAHVIHQSVRPLKVRRPKTPRSLRVIVAGHLRRLKDPLRAAMAVRKLPSDSKIVVHHYGGVLEDRLLEFAKSEAQSNDRYVWHGEVTRGRLLRTMANSWIVVLSSRMEGGANVLSEAIVNGTPALASRIAGSIGILGQDYEGYFDVGDTKGLRNLLLRCEQDPAFYHRLEQQIRVRARLFTPENERQAWRRLLAELS